MQASACGAPFPQGPATRLELELTTEVLCNYQQQSEQRTMRVRMQCLLHLNMLVMESTAVPAARRAPRPAKPITLPSWLDGTRRCRSFLRSACAARAMLK